MIVLSDQALGIPNDGLRLYLEGMPYVFHYVDSHVGRNPDGFMAAWSPHHVPLLILGNLGTDDLEAFERAVPQAKRIGLFAKPTGQYSFRVYEVALSDQQ